MNGVAVDELALSQLLYLIKAKFETLFRIVVKDGSFVRHILARSPSRPHLRSSGDQMSMSMHQHRSCVSMWHRQRKRKRPQSQTQTPPCTARISNPTFSVIAAQATAKITPHSSPMIAMPILQSPPCDYQRRRSPTNADTSPQAAR